MEKEGICLTRSQENAEGMAALPADLDTFWEPYNADLSRRFARVVELLLLFDRR